MAARSKEMRPGFVNTTRSSDGTLTQVTIPDAREEYVNAVKALAILVSPEIDKDKDLSAKREETKQKDKTAYDKYSYQPRVLKLNPQSGFFIKYLDFKYMPKADDILESDTINYQKGRTPFIYSSKGYWNGQVSKYWEEMIKI